MTIEKQLMIASFVLSIIVLSGCSKANTVTPIPTEQIAAEAADSEAACSINSSSDDPALYGLWVKENGDQPDLITFTSTCVYLVENENQNGVIYVRETYYSINSIDWVNSVVDMKMQWVRVNGEYGGFDSPAMLMKVSIDNEQLYFSLTDESLGVPAEATDGPWMKQ